MLATTLLTGCVKDERVEPLEKRVTSLEKEVEQLQFQLRLQGETKGWEGIAYLTPGSAGYAVIKMDLGNLTVSLEDISPYANGSKIKLLFGNLTSATIEGLKATIEWGSVDDKGLPKNKEAKSREVKLTESLVPGNWNKTEVVLEGIPPTALGFVRVRDVGHQAIRLRGSRQ